MMGRYNATDRVLTEAERQLLYYLMLHPLEVVDVDDWDILCDLAGETQGSKISKKRIAVLTKFK